MTTLQELETRHAEWSQWLSVVRLVLGEIDSVQWDATVPRPGKGDPGAPLLARTRLACDARLVQSWLKKLRQAAIRSEMPRFLGWNESLTSEHGAMALFAAALGADAVRCAGLASEAHVDSEAFAAVAALLPVPFLHACRRAWVEVIATDWDEGYCPCCGAWPVCVEVCGIERQRHLRCIRCACAWQYVCLRCPYCSNSDYERLGSLLADGGKELAALEVCEQCAGYIKVFHRLTPSRPAEVLLNDLASVEFDVAAADRGYRRPSGVGFVIDVATPTS
jgi:FdhE protein